MKKLILRFAPSPTGYLHIGNALIALINWLYAKQNGGECILRLDDTDPLRSKKKYVDAIVKDLEWLGIFYERKEKQSLRQNLYDDAIYKLKQQGFLYRCYDTENELKIQRRKARNENRPFIYNRQKSLDLSKNEIYYFENIGRKPHWRFYIKPQIISWTDIIGKTFTINTKYLSDPVLIRENGSILYMLSSIIDDYNMGVNHIIRGADHITNTVFQILLYLALGGKQDDIKFCHIPLVIGEQEIPLSKRMDSFSLYNLREKGIESKTILHFLTQSNQYINNKFLDNIVNEFNIHHFVRKNIKFNLQTIINYNKQTIRNLSFTELKDKVSKYNIIIDEKFWKIIQGNCNYISDIIQWWNIIYKDIIPNTQDTDFINTCIKFLPKGKLNEKTWSLWTGKISIATGRKGKKLFMPLRKALTNLDFGPKMSDILPLIGREKIMKRLSTNYNISSIKEL